MKKDSQEIYVDDTTETPSLLLEQRLPWLMVGLAGAIIVSLFTSRFELILNSNLRLAFFLPAIVYLSDAVGTQTETIYVRNMARHKARFLTYLGKEIIVGLGLGLIFGWLSGLLANYWLSDGALAATVGLATLINVAIAPAVGIIMPTILYKEHSDPALGAGPFTTIIQDMLSLLVYFTTASLILF